MLMDGNSSVAVAALSILLRELALAALALSMLEPECDIVAVSEWISAFGTCFGDCFLWATISTEFGAVSRIFLASWWVLPMRQCSPTITIWSPLVKSPELEAGDPTERDWMKTYFRCVSLPPSMVKPRGRSP